MQHGSAVKDKSNLVCFHAMGAYGGSGDIALETQLYPGLFLTSV
jgi:hypothetical protein